MRDQLASLMIFRPVQLRRSWNALKPLLTARSTQAYFRGQSPLKLDECILYRLSLSSDVMLQALGCPRSTVRDKEYSQGSVHGLLSSSDKRDW